MRKPRDFDAELKALDDKARELKERKLRQLGELVIATGGDALPVEELVGALLEAAIADDRATKEAWRERGAGFFRSPPRKAARGADRRASGGQAAARNRLLAKRARHDTRAWQVKRRERTRQLIELGGLVAKAGLVELTDDDRAVIFGLLIEGAGTLRGERREDALTLWRRRGRREFGGSDSRLDRPNP